MKPLYVLLISFSVLVLIGWWLDVSSLYVWAGSWSMAAMLMFTAVGHFVFTKGMAAMVPKFLPGKIFVVYLTGVLELLFALGLFFQIYPKVFGWSLLVFFVMVLPANIKAAFEKVNYQTGAEDGPGVTYLFFRVPLQLLFMAWVYFLVIR